MGFTAYETIDGQVLSQTSGATTARLVTDALGSVRGRNTGTTFDGLTSYTPYGVGTAPSGTRLGWNGSWGYVRTGQTPPDHYVRARHYSSAQGRWISVDYWWPQEKAYCYTRGNPFTRVDSSGKNVTIVDCKHRCDVDRRFHPSIERTFDDYIRYWCRKFRRGDLVPHIATIDNCIYKTMKAASMECPSFNAKRAACLQEFCHTGRIECGSLPGELAGETNGSRHNNATHDGDVVIDPNHEFLTFDPWSTTGSGVFLHEMFHSCGYMHALEKYDKGSIVYDTTGAEASPYIYCNNIAVCCVIAILQYGKPDHCLSQMKKFRTP
jgi:RHS repeat-associated protein